MYDLIYLILVLYAIKIFVIKLGKYNLKKKSVSVINTKEVDNKVTIKINILNRLKKIINNLLLTLNFFFFLLFFTIFSSNFFTKGLPSSRPFAYITIQLFYYALKYAKC